MPKPKFTSVSFRNHPTDPTKHALHKSMGHNDKAEFTGCVNVSRGDGVTVLGSIGTKPTIWEGTIASVTGSNAKCNNLKVIRVRSRRRKFKPTGGGTEDVSTTISNGQTSNPVPTTIEPLP